MNSGFTGGCRRSGWGVCARLPAVPQGSKGRAIRFIELSGYPLAEKNAAVDIDIGAIHKCRVFTGEKRDQGCDFLGLALAAKRRHPRNSLPHLGLRELVVELRRD